MRGPSGGGVPGTLDIATDGTYNLNAGAFTSRGLAQVKDGAMILVATGGTGALAAGERSSTATLGEREGMWVLKGSGRGENERRARLPRLVTALRHAAGVGLVVALQPGLLIRLRLLRRLRVRAALADQPGRRADARADRRALTRVATDPTPGMPGYRAPGGAFTSAQTMTTTREMTEGTLIITVVDPRSKAPLWRGWAEAELNPKANPYDRQARLAEAVEKILAEFPSRR